MANKGAETRKIGGEWLERIIAASERDKVWLDDAEAAETTFSMDQSNGSYGDIPEFNILHSNVSTIVPAVFNSTPVPDIRPLWVSADPDIPEEMPQQGMMPQQPQGMPQQGMAPPPDMMPKPPSENDIKRDVASLLERAVTVQIDDNKMDSEVEASAQDAVLAGRGIVRVRMDSDVSEEVVIELELNELGEPVEVENTYQTVSNERVSYEAVAWRDYREGPANRFEELPWVAFRHLIDKDALEEFDGGLIKSQELPTDIAGEGGDLVVWEVWCRKKMEVLFIREDSGIVLSQEPDPLELSGFFPIPKPIQPIGLTAKRMPINPYKIYRKQAEELDLITKRIKAITSGLKVRGGIAGDAENIEAIAAAGDNELVPIRNVEAIAQTGGLDRAIIWWPVDAGIKVLHELYISRDQTKQLIYEITGISDIVRGASNSGETATAQQIKTQWGSLRIKGIQRLIERHVRDLFVLTSELIGNNFSAERLTEITGIELNEPMMGMLSGGVEQYIIDVESDSTVRADLTRAKGEMSEFLQGTAAFFSTMAPVVAQAPEMAGAVVDLYASFSRQFNLGKQAEDAVENMGKIAKRAADKQGQSPEQEADAAEKQATAKSEQAKMQLEMQKLQLEVKGKQADMAQAKEFKQADMMVKKAELEIKKFDLTTKNEQARINKETDAELKRLEIQLKEADLRLKEADMQIKAIQAQEEIELEREQKRAVKIGNE